MRFLRGLIVAIGVLLLVIIAGSLIATTVATSSHMAQGQALAALESDSIVTVTDDANTGWITFMPTATTPTTGYILYPGGWVDPRAYALLARDIAAKGYQVTLVPMPLNLAVTNFNVANQVINAFPDITSWAIGGHSLGGAMAAQFIASNPGAVEGLALYAAYPAESTDLSNAPIAATSVYGDNDGVADINDVLGAATRLPPDTVFVLVPGGNHTQFGSYGEGLQSGDNPAGISADEQRQITVQATTDMLERISDN